MKMDYASLNLPAERWPEAVRTHKPTFPKWNAFSFMLPPLYAPIKPLCGLYRGGAFFHRDRAKCEGIIRRPAALIHNQNGEWTGCRDYIPLENLNKCAN